MRTFLAEDGNLALAAGGTLILALAVGVFCSSSLGYKNPVRTTLMSFTFFLSLTLLPAALLYQNLPLIIQIRIEEFWATLLLMVCLVVIPITLGSYTIHKIRQEKHQKLGGISSLVIFLSLPAGAIGCVGLTGYILGILSGTLAGNWWTWLGFLGVAMYALASFAAAIANPEIPSSMKEN